MRDCVLRRVNKGEPANRVIAFCLFGTKAIYVEGAKQNASLAKLVYPGWTVVFYVDSKSDESLIETLVAANAEVRVYDETRVRGYGALLLRFCAADEADVAIFRDADSRLNPREAGAVSEWIASQKRFHVMHEACHDSHRILGGMWGVRSFRDLGAWIDEWASDRNIAYGDDMEFLSERVVPLLNETNTVRHDPANFPPSPYRGFVGQPVNCVKCCTDYSVYADVGCAHVCAAAALSPEVSTALRHKPDVLAAVGAFAGVF